MIVQPLINPCKTLKAFININVGISLLNRDKKSNISIYQNVFINDRLYIYLRLFYLIFKYVVFIKILKRFYIYRFYYE